MEEAEKGGGGWKNDRNELCFPTLALQMYRAPA